MESIIQVDPNIFIISNQHYREENKILIRTVSNVQIINQYLKI